MFLNVFICEEKIGKKWILNYKKWPILHLTCWLNGPMLKYTKKGGVRNFNLIGLKNKNRKHLSFSFDIFYNKKNLFQV